MDGKCHSDVVSDENEKYVIVQGRKGKLCYKVAKKLLKLCSCSSILWKIELGKDEMHTELGFYAKYWSGLVSLVYSKNVKREREL